MRGDITKVSTVGMSREDWVLQRKGTIGGSDAAAIAHLSDYSSPFTVWSDKTFRLPDKPDSEAMRQGRDLEDYVAKRFSEKTGKRVRRENAILYNSAYPFASANIDRWIIGENAGLECKTTSVMNLKKFRGGEFPSNYYCQCMHYMAMTGADRWYLAVLVYSTDFYVFCIERDAEEIETLMQLEKDFWRYVEDDIPPVPDGMECTEDAIGAIYPGGQAAVTDLFGQDRNLETYLMLKDEEKRLKEQVTEIANRLKLDMGDSESGACGRFKVTWKPQEKKTFDSKRFAADHPEMDLSCYYNITRSRPFKVTEKKEKN